MANQNQQKVPDLVPINGSTNVYVGQRYVPKFYDDGTEQHGATWDKTKVYEPLTIVLWEGDSYTSRTFVPEGVEIANTGYWLRTGVFNAQIESIINSNNSIKQQISNMAKSQLIILGEEGIACGAAAYLKNFFPDANIYSLNGGTWSTNSYSLFFSGIASNAKTKNCDLIVCGGFNDLNSNRMNSSNMNLLRAAYNNSGLTGSIYYAYDFWSRDYKVRLRLGENVLPTAMNRLSENDITFLDGLYMIAHNYSFLDAQEKPLLLSNAGFYYAQCLWNLYKTGFPIDWSLNTLDMNVNTNITILSLNAEGESVPTVPAGIMIANGCFIFKTYQTEWTFKVATNSNKILVGNIVYNPGNVNFFKPDQRFYCDCCITANNINIPCWLSAEGTSIYLNIAGSVNNLSSFTMHPSSNVYNLTEF